MDPITLIQLVTDPDFKEMFRRRLQVVTKDQLTTMAATIVYALVTITLALKNSATKENIFLTLWSLQLKCSHEE